MARKGIVIKGSSNVIVDGNSISGMDVAIEFDETSTGRATNNLVFEDMIDRAFAENAILSTLNASQRLEIMRVAQSSSPTTFEGKLRESRIGQWLQDQRFTEWATLSATLMQLGILASAS